MVGHLCVTSSMCHEQVMKHSEPHQLGTGLQRSCKGQAFGDSCHSCRSKQQLLQPNVIHAVRVRHSCCQDPDRCALQGLRVCSSDAERLVWRWVCSEWLCWISGCGPGPRLPCYLHLVTCTSLHHCNTRPGLSYTCLSLMSC